MDRELAAFYQPGETEHEKRRLLDVQSVLTQSRNARIGLALMINPAPTMFDISLP